MKPLVEGTQFGSITVEGKLLEYDVVIRLDGSVTKRKKKLSSALYGTSHIISLAEAEHIHEAGAERLIVGTGQTGLVKLSDQAAEYLAGKECAVDLLPTPEAIRVWNRSEGALIALFHVTC